MQDIRQTHDYRRWKDDVLFRDGYACAICGSTYNLEVHHIKPLAKFPELAIDLNNGITLCQKCHYEQHNKNYSQQLIQSCPSLIGNLHPFFKKLREITYYLSYRTGILKKFWKELPIPRKCKKWVERLVTSTFIFLVALTIAYIGHIING